MARPSLRHHRKFRHLTRLLTNNPALAWGTLELLWHVAYECGDARIGTAPDVEAAACWRGKKGACVAALVAAGFLDLDAETGEYVVHDLDDHAPEYVRKRRQRELARRTRGGQTADTWPTNGSHVPTGCSEVGDTPAPAPAPAPAPVERALPLHGTRNLHRAHAMCKAPFCVPEGSWIDMVAASAGNEARVRDYVYRVWAEVEASSLSPPLDLFKFWRTHWEADHPQPTAAELRQQKSEAAVKNWVPRSARGAS